MKGLRRPRRADGVERLRDDVQLLRRGHARQGEVLARRRPTGGRGRCIWDLGANDGRYSRIAAEGSDYTVALDVDHGVVDRLYRALAQEDGRTILPLVGDIADPVTRAGLARARAAAAGAARDAGYRARPRTRPSPDDQPDDSPAGARRLVRRRSAAS